MSPRYRRSTRPGPVLTTFMCLLLVCMLAVLVGLVVDTADRLTYRAGWAGTPGTLTHVSCSQVGSGKNAHEDCYGEFTPAGDTQFTSVAVEGNTDYPDRSYDARLHSDSETASIVGAKTVAWIVAGVFGALLLVELVAGMLIALVVSRVRRPGWLPGRVVLFGGLWTVAATVVLAVAAMVTGAIVS